MRDTIIINKYLTREYPDDSLSIYLYVCGGPRSKVTAMHKVMTDVVEVFSLVPEYTIRQIVENYLILKSLGYKNGTVKVKPLYDATGLHPSK